MKTMRHRIRIIVLFLTVCLLIVVLWITKAVWFTDENETAIQVESTSLLSPDPWSEPSSNPSLTESSFPEVSAFPDNETPSPEPLFNTFGL